MTGVNQGPETYLERKVALHTLARALKGGYLVLFIGSGVSKSATASFPDWASLVRSCCQKKAVEFDESKAESNTYLRRAVESVEAECAPEEFLTIVESSLYTNVHYDIGLMKTDLLVSLGSLVMNSIRGGAKAIVNYNFDDLLEWYLDYHGFCLEITTEYPSLSGVSDIQVYHPHGFLPHFEKHKSRRTMDIIFSEKKYEKAISSEGDPWNELQRGILGCNVALFVGLSGDDTHIGSLCKIVYDDLLKKQRIIGFQIFLDNKDNHDNEQYNLRRGIVSLYIPTYPDLPHLMLEICHSAAIL